MDADGRLTCRLASVAVGCVMCRVLRVLVCMSCEKVEIRRCCVEDLSASAHQHVHAACCCTNQTLIQHINTHPMTPRLLESSYALPVGS